MKVSRKGEVVVLQKKRLAVHRLHTQVVFPGVATKGTVAKVERRARQTVLIRLEVFGVFGFQISIFSFESEHLGTVEAR